MRLALFAFALLTFSQAHAAKLPPEFDAAKWKKLVSLSEAFGTPTPNPYGIEDRSFRQTTPETLEHDQQPHRLEIFATRGGVNFLDKFEASDAVAVDEDWRKLPNGDWEVEAWFFDVSINGELVDASHSRLVESYNNTVKEIERYPVDLEAPELLERYGKLLNVFFQRYIPAAKN